MRERRRRRSAIQEITRAGGRQEDIDEAAKNALQANFLREFLNRIDETIVFHPLDAKHLRQIVKIQVDRLQKQLVQHDIQLEVTEAALDEIAKLGYDPTYGARPLKRVIQQQIQNPLATEILKGTLGPETGVRVDYRAGEFDFKRIEEPVAAS